MWQRVRQASELVTSDVVESGLEYSGGMASAQYNKSRAETFPGTRHQYPLHNQHLAIPFQNLFRIPRSSR